MYLLLGEKDILTLSEPKINLYIQKFHWNFRQKWEKLTAFKLYSVCYLRGCATANLAAAKPRELAPLSIRAAFSSNSSCLRRRSPYHTVEVYTSSSPAPPSSPDLLSTARRSSPICPRSSASRRRRRRRHRRRGERSCLLHAPSPTSDSTLPSAPTFKVALYLFFTLLFFLSLSPVFVSIVIWEFGCESCS